MNQTVRRSTIVLMAMLLVGTMVGASSAASSNEPVDFTVLASQGPDSAAVQMASQQGFYKEAGLNVTIRTFVSGSDALKVFASGVGDVICMGDLAAVTYWNHSGGLATVISPLTRTSKGYVIEAQSSIKNARDLVGKKIGLAQGSTNQYFLSVYLAKNGIKDSDVTILNLPYSALIPALDKGQIDAFVSFQPMGFESEDMSGSKVHALSTGTGYFEGNYLMAARTTLLTKDPNAVKRFREATRKGMKYAVGHPDAVYAFEQTNYNYDKKLFDRQLSVVIFDMNFDADFNRDMSSMAKWARQSGLIDADVPMSSFLWK